MAGAVVSKELRRKYFNRCNPDEPLGPDDERYVDIDATSSEARGQMWIDALANWIELSKDPVCEFFTGLPGSGKSTELRHLSARLQDEEGAHLLPVLIDAEELLDLANPIDIPDVLVAILYRTDIEVLKAEGKSDEEARKEALKEGRLRRLWHWLSTTEVELSSLEAGVPDVGVEAKAVLDLKTNPSLRATVRSKVQNNMSAFIQADLQLPVHVIYTLPPALVLRLRQSVHFLPMLKLYDRQGKRASGFDVAREIIRQRVPDEHLREFFGAPSCEHRARLLIEASGGYPGEIVRLLQTFVAQPSLDEAQFKRLLSMSADQYRRTVPESALPWLARVYLEKRLIIDSTTTAGRWT